ncbi:hypothetical protein TNCT_134711 [Trichonephila clavata]|uniref:Speckle-type POZ protein n=1 Tax=Trichonephila clavata TaxID=2740835 RepID=A0A8X6FXT5_TRICU|nr:hypothetical protein TNCT_134711 [Trichonephila clavata]
MNSKIEGCVFLWKIENFSSAWHRIGEKIESPIFTLEAIERTQWRLLLYPKGKPVANNIAYFLKREENGEGSESIEINYEFSFLTEDGTILQPSVVSKDSFERGQAKGTCQFKMREEIFYSKCLLHDILTAYCRMWISGSRNTGSVKIFANTIINVDKLSFIWNIEHFSKMGTSQRKAFGIQSALGDVMVILELYLTGNCCDELINISIKSYNTKVRYFRLNSFLLDTTGNRMNCGQLDFRVSDLLQDGKLVLAKKRDLISKKEKFLPNDILSLNCECEFPTDFIFERIARTENGIIYSKFSNETRVEERLSDPSIGLIEALRSMYSDGLFCDTELRTSTHTFSVHKSILSTRSPVFKEKFRNDMKEKTMEHVDITDMETNTMHRMLLYIYIDILEDLSLVSE